MTIQWKLLITNLSSASSFKDDKNMVLDLLAGNFLSSTSNLFYRKKVLSIVGPFAGFRYAHDYDFFLRLCYQVKVHIIEKPLLKYTIYVAEFTSGRSEGGCG